jgi:carboxyl-terminal processing protease
MGKLTKFALIMITGIIFTTVIFGLGAAFGSSAHLFGLGAVRAEDRPAQLDIFFEAWDLAQEHFVDRAALDPKTMTYGAIRGMVQALGDEGHTAFLTPEQIREQETSLSGSFSGIGAQIGVEDNLPVIVAPFDSSPAEEAGIRAGDIILEVDGEDVTTMSISDIVGLIRGEAGSEVVLTVLHRDGQEPVEIPITRGEIDIPAATWAMVPGTDIALIRLSQFSADAESDIKASIQEAKAAGATGLIVDVRNNPGGLLQQAVRVTSQFLNGGNVLLQEDANGNRQEFPVRRGGTAQDIPLVVLINQGSASSAEIFAGAVQDHERGTLVGETTFGTGTVLQPFKLQDGSALLLGTSQWLTPDGRLIRKQGISPDVEVEVPLGTFLVSPDELKQMSADELADSEDAQLLKALALIQQ